MVSETGTRIGFDRRDLLVGGLATFVALGSLVAVTAVSGNNTVDGDLTERLRDAGAGATLSIPPGLWTVSESITVRAKVRFEQGARLRPASAAIITFEQDLETPPHTQIFDLANLHWKAGDVWRVRNNHRDMIWETSGNIRLPGIAFASWFGALEGSGYDNTIAIQALLDSNAREAVLDGFYQHTANWVSENQLLRGLSPYGGGHRSGLKTVPFDRSFVELLDIRDPKSPADGAFRGLSTKSGIAAAAFADFEYDGSASAHFDHRTGYRTYVANEKEIAAGKKAFRRQQMRQGGINIGMDEDGEGYVSPQSTTIERVYIHDTVRSGIVANRAPAVTIRGCRLANSDVDHLIYADRNPDLLVEDCTFSGYAHGGMIVISSGTVRGCVVQDIAANPNPLRHTANIVWLRTDLNEPSLISDLQITGDLGALGNGDKEGQIFKLAGRRDATIKNIVLTHTGSADARFTIFGTQMKAAAITVDGLAAIDMPANATLWNTDLKISEIVMRNVDWNWSNDSQNAEYLMRFGILTGADFDNITVNGAGLDTLVYVDGPARRIGTGRIDARGIAQVVTSGSGGRRSLRN